MDTLLYIAQFLVGLVAIIKGADWLTDGASSIARRFGIPSIVVGLTIVAFGTSTPELVVSVAAALQGNVDIALGNVVGSNIFNILAIIGITSMVKPIIVERGSIRNDIPFALLAAMAVVITAFDSFFNGGEGENIISRTDGLLLICMFAIFLSYTLAIGTAPSNSPQGGRDLAQDTVSAVIPTEVEGSKKEGNSSLDVARDDTAQDIAATPSPNEEGRGEANSSLLTLHSSLFRIVIGLAGLIIGGNWLVDGASGIASLMGVSQSVIALTIVSAGTSSPELAASVMAARKGDSAMALGNVVGSCIFNVFLILGTTATIQPLGVGGITLFDIMTLLVASVLLWGFSKFGKTHYTITRSEGAILTVMAIAYYAVLVYNA